MNGNKQYLLTAVITTLPALLWWFNAARWGWGGIQVACAALWSIVAVIWWIKYWKSRK